LVKLFAEEKPQIALMGATSIGRDLGPRVSSALGSGLTADCTSLEIGDHEEKKENKVYKNLLYQIRPAFGGNIVATIVNPECRPQMATVREGVMKKEVLDAAYKGETKKHEVVKYVSDTDFVVTVIDRHIEKSKTNLKSAPIIVAGGYGLGSKENFQLLFELAALLGGEVGASRAAVDAGFTDHDRQIGQTGVTVRPKLYIACGISGQIPHLAGMQESSIIISVNSDPNAPIIVAGGYGVGSKENFQLLHELAAVIGGEVGASRAAVDAGFTEHDRQIGQTGVTVRPKLYIACGISGQIQHIAGMQESSIIISVNSDPNAPINTIADYVITGTVEEALPKMIKYYKKNTK
jgi:electron transfer flavoprotein alpha subunit